MPELSNCCRRCPRSVRDGDHRDAAGQGVACASSASCRSAKTSPEGFWYDQDEAEWVVVLTGQRAVWRSRERLQERRLGPGDGVYPAGALPPSRQLDRSAAARRCGWRCFWTIKDDAGAVFSLTARERHWMYPMPSSKVPKSGTPDFGLTAFAAPPRGRGKAANRVAPCVRCSEPRRVLAARSLYNRDGGRA